MAYNELKSKDWNEVKAGDVFKYVYENRDIYIGICDSIGEDGEVIVSDIYEVIGDNNMDFGFNISPGDKEDHWEFKLVEILFHHKTALEVLKDRYPELTI